MKIGIDMDDTLVSFVRPMIEFHKRNFGPVPDYEQTNRFDLSQVWNCSAEESHRRVSAFFDSAEFRSVPPVESAVEAVRHLSRNHTLFAVTSRPVYLGLLSSISLASNFPGCFEDVFLTGQYSLNDSRITKGQICAEQRISVLIEDCAQHAVEALDYGVSSFLIERPWNREVDVDLAVVKVKSWEEIVGHVSRMRNY